MRKEDDGGKNKNKIMSFSVATNIVVSQPPETLTDWNTDRSCQIVSCRKIPLFFHFCESFPYLIVISSLLYSKVGDIYRYTYRQIRVYLPVHLAAIITDRRVYSLGLLGWVRS